MDSYGFIWVELQNVHVLVISFIFQHQQGEIHRNPSCSESQVDEQDLGASDAVNPRAAESQVLLQRDHQGVKVDCINLCIYIYTCVGVCYTATYTCIICLYSLIFIYIMYCFFSFLRVFVCVCSIGGLWEAKPSGPRRFDC